MLEDGTEEYADIIISNADGRKTLLELLGGRFMNRKLEAYCGDPEDETNWAVHVFLGVDRDLSYDGRAGIYAVIDDIEEVPAFLRA